MSENKPTFEDLAKSHEEEKSKKKWKFKGMLLAITLLFCASLGIYYAVKRKIPFKRRVYLFSVKGLRWDDFNNTYTGNIHDLREKGVYVKYVFNAFPTRTLPNQISMVTGLYPESHGMINDVMLNLTTSDIFRYETTRNKTWWTGFEPIWVTNQKHGRKSLVVNWPGGNVELAGQYPSFFLQPNDPDTAKSPKEQVDFIVNTVEQNREINLVCLYYDHFSTMLSTRQNVTDYSSPMEGALRTVDHMVGYLMKRLAKAKLEKNAHIIVTGDHGRTPRKRGSTIYLEDFINTKQLLSFSTGVTARFLWPVENRLQEVYHRLKNSHPKMTVYLKSDIPERFHIKHHIHMSPILVNVEQGWVVRTKFDNESSGEVGQERYGYDSYIRDMNPGFVGYGRAFKTNYTRNAVNITDIYNIVCHIIGLEPLKNDGNIEYVRDLFNL